MSLAAPWALFGLLALPLVWWLHKKLRRPPDVVLPSLMFLQDEDEAQSLPRGRRIDAELLLALAAVALLAFAAAGPTIEQHAPRRLVRVVVSGGGGAFRTDYRRDVRKTLTDLRAALDAEDRVQVVWLPAPPQEGFYRRRPTEAALLGTALSGAASLRVVISDLPVPAAAQGVQWIALGSPTASNTGIVAVSVSGEGAARALFVTTAHRGPNPVRGTLEAKPRNVLAAAQRTAFQIEADGAESKRIPISTFQGADFDLELATESGGAWQDDLSHDDSVFLRHGPLGVHIDTRLPTLLAERLRHGLTAALGPGGFDEQRTPVLAFVPRGKDLARPGLRVEFETVPEGAPTERCPAGQDLVTTDEIARDLTTQGAGWMFAVGAADVQARERVTLGRQVGARTWPILMRTGQRVRFGPDPLRGAPRPIDTPFWPLFIQNVVGASGHKSVGAGYRAVGLLDPASTRFGRARTPLDAASVRASKPSVSGRERPLRGLLVWCALACLALLWAAPRIRSALARGRRVVAAV